jgi:hypothetical protein
VGVKAGPQSQAMVRFSGQTDLLLSRRVEQMTGRNPFRLAPTPIETQATRGLLSVLIAPNRSRLPNYCQPSRIGFTARGAAAVCPHGASGIASCLGRRWHAPRLSAADGPVTTASGQTRTSSLGAARPLVLNHARHGITIGKGAATPGDGE